MASIKVNYKTLHDLAEGIKEYAAYQKNQMLQADFAVKSMLATDWLGPDAREFEKKWSGVDDKGSESTDFSNALVEYKNMLALCANEYQIAQETAINRALYLYNNLTTDKF
ncbi:MAG: hypothetical protein FWH48_01970 [Oscillospiraceae bacterium]|nr:hypothetical protein [Oscillospiraceae bacterium]